MNAFARTLATESRLLTRSCEALLGLCQGLLADHVLNESELHFLALWLRDHPDIADVWPGTVIVDRIRDILADGIVTEEELKQLKEVLTSLLGGTWEQTGAATGLSTELPIQDDTPVILVDRRFCFSGRFIFGTRSACESFVIARGGIINKTITKDLDFLVIGTFISPDWLNTSFGRKIEKAVGYQQEGCKVRIVSEKRWSESIERA
jgi:NAD-dependent DNA ligase